MNVAILVLSGVSLMTVASTVEPLRAANRVAGRTVFDWRLVSADGAPVAATAGLDIPVSSRFDPDAIGGLFVIVAGIGAYDVRDRRLIAGIHRAARRAEAVYGIEAGAWLLARAGLIDGRAATTHWEDFEEFAAAFPMVDVRPDRYVRDGTIYTAAGASPAFDMMIDAVRRHAGPAIALDVASVFIYEASRGAGDAQALVSLGRTEGRDRRLIEAIRIMESRIDRPVTIAAIARRLGLCVRALELIFRREMGLAPGAYFLTLRLSAARRLVEDTRLSFADIAGRTGFSSTASFSRAFRRAFQRSPSEMRAGGRN